MEIKNQVYYDLFKIAFESCCRNNNTVLAADDARDLAERAVRFLLTEGVIGEEGKSIHDQL